jgi:hypothetical protein
MIGFDPVSLIMGTLFSYALGKMFGGPSYPSFEDLTPEQQQGILVNEYNRLMEESRQAVGGGDGDFDTEGSLADSPEMMYDFFERLNALEPSTPAGQEMLEGLSSEFEQTWGESVEEFADVAENPLDSPQQDLIDSDLTGDSDMFYDAVGEAEANPVEITQQDVADILARIGAGQDAVEVLNDYGVYVDPNGVNLDDWTDAGGSIADRVTIVESTQAAGGGGGDTASDAGSEGGATGSVSPAPSEGVSGDPSDPTGSEGVPGDDDYSRIAVYENGEWVFNDGTRVPAAEGDYNNGDTYSIFQKQDGTWDGEHAVGDPTPVDTPGVIITPTTGGQDSGSDGSNTGSGTGGTVGGDSNTGGVIDITDPVVGGPATGPGGSVIQPGDGGGTGTDTGNQNVGDGGTGNDTGGGTGDQQGADGPGSGTGTPGGGTTDPGGGDTGGTGGGTNTGNTGGDGTGSGGDGHGDGGVGVGIGIGLGLFSGGRSRVQDIMGSPYIENTYNRPGMLGLSRNRRINYR